MKLSISHGSAENISYGSHLTSTSFYWSYIFDKLQAEFIYKDKRDNIFDKFGISFQLEQRYYELESSQYSFDNWKFYLDGLTKIWIDWYFMDNIGIKTWYQYRWRNADSPLYGDFEWIEDIKSHTKHELWMEISLLTVFDYFY